MTDAAAIGALLLEVARGSEGSYVLVRQGQRRRSPEATGVREWRVSVRMAQTPGAAPRERSCAGRELVDALTRAAEALRGGAG